MALQESMDLGESFEVLGKADPGKDGVAFAVTHKDLVDHYDGDARKLLEAIPEAPYEYRVYFDMMTDSFLVMRPGQNGAYFSGYNNEWKRIR